MNTTNYLALLGVALILAVTPGPDTLLTLQYSLRQRRAGVLAALGTTSGIFVWAALVAAGVATFLRNSPTAFHAFQVLGGSYLIFLGCRALSHHRPRGAEPRVPPSGLVESAAPDSGATASLSTAVAHRPLLTAPSAGASFLAGLLCCLSNPKTGLFFLALIPQFTPANAGPLFVIAVVGGTVAAVIGAYLMIVATAADTASAWLSRPSVDRVIVRVSGGVFIVLGLTTLAPVLTEMIDVLMAGR